MQDLLAIVQEELEELTRLRRDFHRHPEPSFEEERTSRVVAEYLEGLGFDVVRPDGMHGLWADLEVPGAEKRIAFRADMDALRMQESACPTKAGFLSENDGVAHCCGHDSHMAMLLIAAKLLKEGRAEARHSIRFLFQHAEEMPPGGAIEMIEKGCLDGVDEVYGMHVIPPIPSGLFNVLPGPFMAAADTIHITVEGKGGHAAMPHLVRDPNVAAAQVVLALQQLVSRRMSPLLPSVISITAIHSEGHAHNVIPDRVELTGTVRNLDAGQRKSLESLIAESASSAARPSGCTATLRYERGYDVLVNDRAATEKGAEAVRRQFGEKALLPNPTPILAGEDFAYFARERPSCYVFLGVGSSEQGITMPNHATDFDVDESALPRGSAWFLELARL